MAAALFDAALLAYPFYCSASIVQDYAWSVKATEGLTQLEKIQLAKEIRRLSYLWMMYAATNIAGELGLAELPGWNLLRAGTMIAMYSREHSSVFTEWVVPSASDRIVDFGKKAGEWWTQNAQPRVEQINLRTRLQEAAQKHIGGLFGWM